MEIKDKQELVDIAHALQNDEDVNLAAKVEGGQRKIRLLEKIMKELDEKK